MLNNRIEYIDVAKGMCMLLVVWQHTHTYYPSLETGEFWMESFRMPLFFIISGMFFKLYNGFGEFMRKKTNQIIIPFLFFYLIFSVIIPNLLNSLGYEGLRQSEKLGWTTSLLNCIFEKVYSNSPVWFLLALLWLNLFFYVIVSFSNKYKYANIITITFSIILGLCGFFLGVNNIFVWANIDNALTASPFFCFGYLMFNSKIIFQNHNFKILSLCIVLGIVFTLLFSHGLSFKQNNWELKDLFPLYSCGIIGSIAILAISKVAEKSRVLKFYGENTLTLLCMQMPVIQFVNLFTKKMGTSPMLEFVLTFIGTILLFCIIIPFMNRFLPWFVGKKNLI